MIEEAFVIDESTTKLPLKVPPSIFNSIGSVFPVLFDNSTLPLIIVVPFTVNFTPYVLVE